MKTIDIFFVWLTLLVLFYRGASQAYVNSEEQSFAYYEQFSHLPILHVYFNRHFSKTPQFEPFMETLRSVEDKVSHYAKIVLTDCESSKQAKKMFSCQKIKQTNQNRFLVGFIPSNQLTTFGTKLIQGAPRNKFFDHFNDRYQEQEIINFINSLLPNFFKPLSNLQQYERFLLPKYVPKVIFFSNQQEINSIPFVLKQLHLEYYLKFDFGFVEDLTEEILNKLEIKTIPSLIIIKYDFEENKHNIIRYSGKSFHESNYPQLNDFLAPHALSEPRNDLLYHQIFRQSSSEIITIQKQSQLNYYKQRANGWIFIQRTASLQPSKLISLKQKYSLFYDYIHFIDPKEETLSAYSPQMNATYIIDGQVQFNPLNKSAFLSSASLWLDRDYVVVAVRQKYAHLCALTQKTIFRGLTHCIIAQQSQYEQIAESFGSKFEVGIVWSKKTLRDGRKQAAGVQISNPQFVEAYQVLQYRTKLKVKQIMDKFLKNPIDQIVTNIQLQRLCFFYNKKCVIFLTTPSKNKDRTKRDYLKQIALSLAQQYRFYQIDPTCNQPFIEQVKKINPKLNYTKDKLIVYHPKKQSLSLMQAKMTKSNIEDFLRSNYVDQIDGSIKLENLQVMLYNCNSLKENEKKQLNEQNIELNEEDEL